MSCLPNFFLLSFLVHIHHSNLVANYEPRPCDSFYIEYDKDFIKDAYDLETLKELFKELAAERHGGRQ
jgi:hypothetical protein